MQQIAEEYSRSDLFKASFLPWLVCFAASLFFFYEFIQGNMFASIADDIMQAFSIQADKMSYLSSVFYAANVIFLFVAGALLDRFSTKKIILVAMAACVLSTFVLAYAHTFWVALICRFVMGIGSAFCFLGPIRIASRWFPPKRMALVSGAIVTMAMTGGMLAQYPLTKLVLSIGWRASLVQVGWLGLGIMALMAYWIKDNPENYHEEQSAEQGMLASAKKAYLNGQTLGAALYTSLMNMAVAVFGAMMGSLYLIQRLDVTKEQAAMVNSMLFLGVIIGGPVIGWVSDKLGLRVLPMKIGVLNALGLILAILYLPLSLGQMGTLFFLLGFFTAAQVISYALVAESSPPALTATALSTVSILTQAGYIVYQILFSTLLTWNSHSDAAQGATSYTLSDYQSAAIIIPIGLLVALVAAFKLKESHCR